MRQGCTGKSLPLSSVPAIQKEFPLQPDLAIRVDRAEYLHDLTYPALHGVEVLLGWIRYDNAAITRFRSTTIRAAELD